MPSVVSDVVVEVYVSVSVRSSLFGQFVAPAGLSPRGETPEEAIIEGCAYIYRMYLQSEYTVCIPDKISICSNRGRMESLGNDDVLSLNARIGSLGNDDISLMIGNDCDVTMIRYLRFSQSFLEAVYFYLACSNVYNV